MFKSDVFMLTGAVLITTALILWEDFGMMITPSILTVVSAGCFLMSVRCWSKEEKQDEIRF